MDGVRGLPPPLPGTPPVANVQAAPGQATPPIYASPLYRPDTDLTLPPPDAGTNPVRVCYNNHFFFLFFNDYYDFII